MSTTDTSTTETVTETAPAETQVIGLTDSAKQKVGELLTMEGNPELALRIAVRPGGCSGYSYEMFFDSDIAPDDIRSTYGQVRVVVDPASAQLLSGATLEYKDGLQGAGFSIDNPNAQRSCGCGQSFS
ncbi:MAG: iron-sulfur cluster insertion protein ErpA [Actinomycetota bacterium]|nr:iron-sulfur cluster insertion protein ErpA [Actinomycetota bacterium]